MNTPIVDDETTKSFQREYLLAKGWDWVMKEEDGCETWQFPFSLRKDTWPIWLFKLPEGNRYWWDLDEALELQRELDKWKKV